MNRLNRFNRLFSEILHNPLMAMEVTRFNAAYALVMENMRAGLDIEFEPKTLTRLVPVAAHHDNKAWSAAAEGIECSSMADVSASLSGESMSSNDTFVNVVCIEDTMTRGGDACTYGSKDHKAMMMGAADDDRCRGHILYINSGGGAVGTLLDYRDAINYCLERGQNVAAVIQECAASAACFTSNMSGRVFVEREDAEVGSLGMFAAFTTIADGTVIPYTNEVMHIRYAKQSKDKNFEMREAADGNLKPIDDMLTTELDAILSDTQKDRPSVKADQLTGKMYKAKDVMGSLVDEVGDIDAAINWLCADWEARNGAPLPLKLKADTSEPAPAATASSVTAPVPSASAEGSNNPQPTTTPMFEHIAAALGIESIEHTAEGVMLNTPLAEALEQHLADHAATVASLQEAVAQHEETVAALAAANEQVAALTAAATEAEATHAAAIESLNAAHAAAVEAINAAHAQATSDMLAEHAAALEAAQAATAEANINLATANEQLATVTGQLEAAKQRVADLSAEVETLNNAGGQQPQAGQQPASNGKSGEPLSVVSATYTYDPSLSARENAERRKQAMGK